MATKRNRTAEKPNISAAKVLIGSLIGLLMTVLMTFILAVLVNQNILDFNHVRRTGPILIGVSSLSASAAAGRHGSKKLIHGLLSSCLYGLLLLICGMLLFSAPMQPGNLVLSAVALLVGSLAGIFAFSAFE